VGNRVKMTDVGNNQLMNAAQFEYIELSSPAQKSYQEGIKCTKQLTFFLPADVLHRARVEWAANKYT
jgi:hypothetical protein